MGIIYENKDTKSQLISFNEKMRLKKRRKHKNEKDQTNGKYYLKDTSWKAWKSNKEQNKKLYTFLFNSL